MYGNQGIKRNTKVNGEIKRRDPKRSADAKRSTLARRAARAAKYSI